MYICMYIVSTLKTCVWYVCVFIYIYIRNNRERSTTSEAAKSEFSEGTYVWRTYPYVWLAYHVCMVSISVCMASISVCTANIFVCMVNIFVCMVNISVCMVSISVYMASIHTPSPKNFQQLVCVCVCMQRYMTHVQVTQSRPHCSLTWIRRQTWEHTSLLHVCTYMHIHMQCTLKWIRRKHCILTLHTHMNKKKNMRTYLITSYNTPLQHTPETHPCNTPMQHNTPATHPCNTPLQHTPAVFARVRRTHICGGIRIAFLHSYEYH